MTAKTPSHWNETSRMRKLNITRRDFVGGTMLGAGAMLLDMVAPGKSQAAETGHPPST